MEIDPKNYVPREILRTSGGSAGGARVSSGNSVIDAGIRDAGLINVMAGLCVGIAYVLHPQYATPQEVSGSTWFLVHLLLAISLIGGILGAVGLFAHHSRLTGWLGLIGFGSVVTALTLVFGLNYWELFISPVVAVEAPTFVQRYGGGETIGLVKAVFPASGALFVFGYILLCGDIIRARSLSRGSAWLTIVGVLVFGAGLSGYLPMGVVRLGAVIFAIGLIWMGLSLWSMRRS